MKPNCELNWIEDKQATLSNGLSPNITIGFQSESRSTLVDKHTFRRYPFRKLSSEEIERSHVYFLLILEPRLVAYALTNYFFTL